MAIELVTFKDMRDFVLEESNLNKNNSTASNRVNRLLNVVYEDVMQQKPWRFSEAASSTVVPQVYSTGNVAVTMGSATIVGNASVTFTASMAGRHLYLDLDQSEYKISSFTDATNLVLSETYYGATGASQAYRIYQKEYTLPVNCEEVIDVFHFSGGARRSVKTPKDRQSFLNIQGNNPQREYYAESWTHGDWTSSGTRTMLLWPPGHSDNPYRIKYKYMQKPTALSASTDTSVIPKSYRSVLPYGALEQVFIQQGNVQRAAWAKSMYQNKLHRLLNDYEVTDRSLQLYVNWKNRGRRPTAGRYDLGSSFDDDSAFD